MTAWSAPVVIAAVALTVCGNASSFAQTAAPVTPNAPTPQEQPAPAAGAASATGGLSDLDGMTFDCAKASLNAAAREAAKVPSQGTYQFAYFKIVNDSHHSSYEIHFKSNYHGEPDLKYCVSMYCQQGWDPKTTTTSVSLIGNERQRKGMPTHAGACGMQHAPAKHSLER
jgi:hypothetical protein